MPDMGPVHREDDEANASAGLAPDASPRQVTALCLILRKALVHTSSSACNLLTTLHEHLAPGYMRTCESFVQDPA